MSHPYAYASLYCITNHKGIGYSTNDGSFHVIALYLRDIGDAGMEKGRGWAWIFTGAGFLRKNLSWKPCFLIPEKVMDSCLFPFN